MIDDTIYAVASPPGSAARGILRLSGPEALAAAGKVLADSPPTARACTESSVRVLGSSVRCLVLTMPAPHSYTGEDVVELVLSRCNDVESGGRVIDAILTNSLLPDLSRRFLIRTMEGEGVSKVEVAVKDSDFDYSFC